MMDGEGNGTEMVLNTIVDSEAPVFDGDEDQDFATLDPDDPADDESLEPLGDARDLRGRFTPGGRPGPGRGHFACRSNANATSDVGAGEPMSNVALIGLIDAAISRRGTRFWDELTKERPAVVAQLRGTLARLEDVAPGSTGGDREPITILLPDAMVPSEAGRRVDSVMGPPPVDAMAPSDMAAEISRLRTELEAEKRRANGLPPPVSDYRPSVAAQPGEPAECPTCASLGYPGRMIQPGGKCAYGCGQTYHLAAKGIKEIVPKGDGECRDTSAWVAGDDASGWTSHGSIGEALASVATGGSRRRDRYW
jgi:hypothetical protein